MQGRACLLLAALTLAGPANAAEPPRLVVQLTFDQLRGDLLERYGPAFTGGFRRILDQGWWVEHGEAAHGLTLSWSGHATLATGRYPSHHGLTANEWWELVGTEWRSVSVVDDPRYRIVARDSQSGLSPWRLQESAIGDWFKREFPGAKALAIGSDAAIAYAGQRPDGVYWLDSRASGYTTSTYYRSDLPAWVTNLNARLQRLPRAWSFSVPERWRALASHPEECPPLDATAPWSPGTARMLGPHVPEQGEAASGNQLISWMRSTPLPDELLLRSVGDLVTAERLGQDSTPDYLALAIGATDSVGHEFGPISLEQLDTLVRLDRALAKMLDDLDRTVGRGRYVLAISADHGSVDPPEQRCQPRVTTAEIEALLDRVEAIAKAHRGTQQDLVARIVAELRQAPFIADVYPQERLASSAKDDWMAELMKRSFVPGRTTDFPLWTDKPRVYHPARYGIHVQFKEGMIFDRARSVHGSPYDYDRLVPVIFYGLGVPKRTAERGAWTVDVAPTLAALAGIELPPGLDGRPLIQLEGQK